MGRTYTINDTESLIRVLRMVQASMTTGDAARFIDDDVQDGLEFDEGTQGRLEQDARADLKELRREIDIALRSLERTPARA